MARTIAFQKPRKHTACASINALAAALSASRACLQDLAKKHGLIKPVRGKWDTARVVPVLEAWNTIAEERGRRHPQDVEAVRLMLKTGKPPERKEPEAKPASAPSTESEMVPLPTHPLQRKQFLEGELLKMRLAERRGDLLERAQVVQDLQTVAELVPKLLAPFIREIYPELVLISNPEEAIEWGTGKLRERVDRIANEMTKLYGTAAKHD